MTREEWCKSLYETIPKCEIHKLEEADDIVILQEKHKCGNGIPCYMISTPQYYVWQGDTLILSTSNYHYAINKFKELAVRKLKYFCSKNKCDESCELHNMNCNFDKYDITKLKNVIQMIKNK